MDETNVYVLLERNLQLPIRLVPPAGEYTIRPFRMGEADLWTTIQNRIFEPHKAQKFHEYFGSDFSGNGVFFAQQGDKAVGIAAGILKQFKKGIPFGVVDWVGVIPEHRRNNVASALVTYVLRHLKAKGLFFASLTTPSYRVNGIKMYRKLGFDLVAQNEQEQIVKLQIERAENLFSPPLSIIPVSNKDITGSQSTQ